MVAKLQSGSSKPARSRRFDGMRLIRGGTFLMGSEAYYADERPVRPAMVGDFWMDETPVTNAQFARFVEATGHVTFAELPPDPRDYPGLDLDLALAGSAVFTPPARQGFAPLTSTTPVSWWDFTPGACWRAPSGPGSDLAGLDDHPVVHVVAADAEAYGRWAGKTLPSEAEWEYAARAGAVTEFPWGDTLEPDGVRMAKTWQGEFPTVNLAPAGLERTGPVRGYPANALGLYAMIGNVWEWTSDWYTASPVVDRPCCGGGTRRRAESCDPASPAAPIPRRVLKGGSHLCAPSYCQRYRPAARWAQPIDTSTTHVGFRCIVRR